MVAPMAEETFTAFVQRASVAFAQARLQTGLGRALEHEEIELCAIEAALLYKSVDERQVFEQESELLSRAQALREQLDQRLG